MKFKNLLLLLFVAIATVSCSKDDEKTPQEEVKNEIYGSWVVESNTYNYYEKGKLIYSEITYPLSQDREDYYTFSKEDSRGFYENYINSDLADVGSFEFELNGTGLNFYNVEYAIAFENGYLILTSEHVDGDDKNVNIQKLKKVDIREIHRY